MTDCEHVREILDAYAIGAAGAADARAIDEHVAECVRCWEEMSKARQTAALLALTSPMSKAPAALEGRIVDAAAREHRAAGAMTKSRPGRIRLGWPAAAAGLGLAAAAALAFASFLQIQMNDLRNDKDALAEELHVTQDVVRDQARVISISAAGDSQRLVMEGVAAPEGVWGEYFWSRSAGGGFIVCHEMPALPEGEVYQAWFVLGTQMVSAGTFAPSEDGGCIYPMDPEEPVRGPDGVGVSQESAGGSESPSGEWLVWASFDR